MSKLGAAVTATDKTRPDLLAAELTKTGVRRAPCPPAVKNTAVPPNLTRSRPGAGSSSTRTNESMPPDVDVSLHCTLLSLSFQQQLGMISRPPNYPCWSPDASSLGSGEFVRLVTRARACGWL